MVVAAVCPVHGPFESRIFSLVDCTNVSFTGNQESCPTPGCGEMAEIMDGNFTFAGGETIIHQAPEWTIQALTSVTQALGQALRVAALRNSTAQEIEEAYLHAAEMAREETKDIPDSIRQQLLNKLPLKIHPGKKGMKLWAVVALGSAMFLLHNYTTVRDNAIALAKDSATAIEWIIDQVGDLNEEEQTQFREELSEIRSDR